jgi:hypothetical protein
MTKATILSIVAGLLLAAVPAQAQFMTNYPVIIVPPPPAQNVVVPRPSPTTTQLDRQFPPSPNPSPDPRQCTYHGRVKVCE